MNEKHAKQGEPIKTVAGTGIVVRGNDIDTDQIIPARYMKVVTFDGLGEFAFGDLRAEAKEHGTTHPFDNPQYAGAAVLISNKNFGCGSSREHAPQSLMRWGVQCVIAESFAEIFAGNCTSLGIPTATLASDKIEEVMTLVEAKPDTQLVVDLEQLKLHLIEVTGTSESASEDEDTGVHGTTYPLAMSETYRNALSLGKWDSTTILLEHIDQAEAKGQTLPYMSGFASV